jgi:ribosomal protein S18 acetylase RimI-like enzyme
MGAEIRRVYASDRDDVLEISRHVWEGHDYLPSVIDDWLNEPGSFMYGVEMENRLVAVANLRVVESGRTGWMEGLRVHPDFRRRGFANLLTEYLIGRAEETSVQRLRYTTSTENNASLQLAKKYGFSEILQRGVFWQPTPQALPSANTALHIRQSDPEEVHNLLRDNPDLIADAVLVYDWKALDVTLDTLTTIGRSHDFYIATREGIIDSLSFGHRRSSATDAHWSFTMHTLESAGFLVHLSHNIMVASKQGLRSVTGTYEIRFEEILQKASGISADHWGTRLILLERSIS